MYGFWDSDIKKCDKAAEIGVKRYGKDSRHG
jgi:hypothetical protein